MSALIEAASPHVMNTYGRLPIALERGQGCRVWDVNGKEYLDALGGIAVNTLGHNHPKLVPALQNYYHVPGQEQLAAQLVELSGMSNVFFCNSGLEANEAALKIARKFGVDKGIANRKSWSMKRPSMGARLPPCRPRATPKSTPALAPWWKASSAYRSTT